MRCFCALLYSRTDIDGLRLLCLLYSFIAYCVLYTMCVCVCVYSTFDFESTVYLIFEVQTCTKLSERPFII